MLLIADHKRKYPILTKVEETLLLNMCNIVEGDISIKWQRRPRKEEEDDRERRVVDDYLSFMSSLYEGTYSKALRKSLRGIQKEVDKVYRVAMGETCNSQTYKKSDMRAKFLAYRGCRLTRAAGLYFDLKYGFVTIKDAQIGHAVCDYAFEGTEWGRKRNTHRGNNWIREIAPYREMETFRGGYRCHDYYADYLCYEPRNKGKYYQYVWETAKSAIKKEWAGPILFMFRGEPHRTREYSRAISRKRGPQDWCLLDRKSYKRLFAIHGYYPELKQAKCENKDEYYTFDELGDIEPLPEISFGRKKAYRSTHVFATSKHLGKVPIYMVGEGDAERFTSSITSRYRTRYYRLIEGELRGRLVNKDDIRYRQDDNLVGEFHKRPAECWLSLLRYIGNSIPELCDYIATVAIPGLLDDIKVLKIDRWEEYAPPAKIIDNYMAITNS